MTKRVTLVVTSARVRVRHPTIEQEGTSPRRAGVARGVMLAVLFVLTLTSISATRARATWQRILTNSAGRVTFTAISFTDELFGVVGSRGQDSVWVTTDGGTTWRGSALPGMPPGGITQIRMVDHVHGWLTGELGVGGGKKTPSLYETTDGAKTWRAKPPTDLATDVYQTGNTVLVANRDTLGTITGYISTNGGTTFSGNILRCTNGIAFVDPMHGVTTGFAEQDWYRTVDGGLTWQTMAPAQRIESWSVYGVKGTATFYTAGEQDWSLYTSHPLSSVYRSTDYGATWTKVSNLGLRTTGHIDGVGETLYIQTYAGSDAGAWQKGIYRSTDRGRTWFFVGGPATDRDTRFAVLGCQGNVVIAADSVGGLWRTMDGGDGTLEQATISGPLLTVDSIDVCQPRDTVITIAATGCDTLYLTSATTPTLPSLEVLAANGTAATFPYVIPPGTQLRLRLRLSTNVAGPYASYVIFQHRQAGLQVTDTVFVRSALRYSNPLKVSPLSVRFDSTAMCDSHDSVLLLVNPGCFTISLVDARFKKDSSFALVTPVLNDSIPAGTTKLIPFRFTPAHLYGNTDSLIVDLRALGRTVRVAIPVIGFGKPDAPKFVMSLGSAIDFDTISICQGQTDLAFAVTNPGCTPLQMTMALLDSDRKAAPPSDMFKWYVPSSAKSIHNGDSAFLLIRVLPLRVGYYRGYLKVSYAIQGRTAVDTFVPFQVFVKSGSKVLSLDDQLHDLDTITFCSQKDVAIPIRNLGCDTMIFRLLKVAGSGFIVVNPPHLPMNVLPHDSTVLTIRFLPNAAGLANGSITVTTDADSAASRSVAFTGYALPTDTITCRAISPNMTVTPGDTALIEIRSNRTFTHKGVTRIDLTLEYNGDVMTPYAPAVETQSELIGAFVIPPIETPVGPRLRHLTLQIMGTDLTLDSTKDIVKTRFVVTVSDTTSTQFHIVGFSLNGGDPQFGKCLLGAVSDSGTIGLHFICGDTQIYRFMHDGLGYRPVDGVAPSVRAVTPLPYRSDGEGRTVSLPFLALRPVTARLEVFDARGAVVLTEVLHISSAGEAAFAIAPKALPSGSYHFVITPADGSAGRARGEFVILR